MEDAAEMHRRAGAPRQLSVDVRLPQDENLTVFADASLVRRVLENLMGNALKFSPIGGVVTLAAEAQRRGDRGGVCLSVSDQGPGIPVDQRTRVFEKFVTLPGAAAGRQTGLGLTFVRDVVLAHGGAIAVTEAEGGGARFDLWLPESTT
jgi:signal transduction histidine kinase